MEDSLEIAGGSHPERVKFHAQHPSCRFRLFELWWGDRTGCVPENADPRDSGDDLPKELEPFADDVRKLETQPRYVSSRSGETEDETGRHRIGHKRHHNGNRGGCLLGSQTRRRSLRRDDVHLEADQLAREAGEPFGATLRISERDIGTRKAREKSHPRDLAGHIPIQLFVGAHRILNPAEDFK